MRFGDMINDFIDALNSLIGMMTVSLGGSIKDSMEKPMNFLFTGVGSSEFNDLYDLFLPIGIVLTVLYVLIDLLNKATMINFSVDILIKNMIRLVIGISVINNGLAIMEGLNGLSVMTADLIWGTLPSSMMATTNVSAVAGISTATFWDLILGVLQIIELLVSGKLILILGEIILIDFLVVIVAYQRAVKLSYLMIVSPLIFADMTGHGLSTKSQKYIKRLFAAFMEYPVMILGVGAALTLSASTDLGTYVATYAELFAVFATIGILFKSKQIAKQIFG